MADADSPDFVQFGCMRCKRTKRTHAIDAAAERAVQAIITASYDVIHAEALSLGVEIPDTFRTKMLEWARKQSIIPAEKPPVLNFNQYD